MAWVLSFDDIESITEQELRWQEKCSCKKKAIGAETFETYHDRADQVEGVEDHRITQKIGNISVNPPRAPVEHQDG